MAFKMKGFSAFTKQEDKKVILEKTDIEYLPLQEGEDPDVQIYKGNDWDEQINDIEDRIEFVQNDIDDEQGGKMKPEQRSALAALDQKLRELQRNTPKSEEVSLDDDQEKEMQTGNYDEVD